MITSTTGGTVNRSIRSLIILAGYAVTSAVAVTALAAAGKG